MPLNAGILDPSIVTQGVRESKIDLATPVNIYASIGADRRAQKLSELTLSREEKAQKRLEEYQGILKSSVTDKGFIDSERAIVGLNRAGFTDEANAIQERYQKAAEAKRQAMEKQSQDMSTAFLTAVDSENPVEAFMLVREEGLKNGWKMSPGLMQYNPSDEEIASGEFKNPKVKQELLYHGERYLTPEQRIARAKESKEAASPDEFGLTPIYGTKNGKPVALQTSKKGGIKEIELPPGVELTPGVSYKDVGDRVVIFDKSGAAVASVGKGIDPGKKADLEIDRAKEARDAQEYAKKVRSYDTKVKGEMDSIQTFIDRAYKVKNNENMKYVTGIGKVGRLVPGTEAANLQADIDFLVSSGVIETLTQLKNQSPTGATGFGALSDSELTAIKNAFSILGNVDISPAKKKAEVARVLDIMEKRLREHREIARDSDKTLGPEPTEAEKLDEGIKGL